MLSGLDDVDQSYELTAPVMSKGGTSGVTNSDYNDVQDFVEPALIVKSPQDTTALVGDRLVLKATYMGHPEPVVKWNKGNRELKNDEKTSITSRKGLSCLLLQDITADDSGKYEIRIENSHGADCAFVFVSVEGPPDPPSGKPCVKSNLDTVKIAWSSSPYDGGKMITGYAVEYSLAGSGVWSTAIEDCHSLNYEIKGFQKGTQYIFRIRAKNVHGLSKPSAVSDILLLEENGGPFSFEPRVVTLQPGPEFRLRYEIFEELGKGRFGVVHRLVDKASGQKLAAKFIKCRTGKDKDKVQEEIDIMNQLNHDKLLQLAAAFENPREIIMVTEYISGGELFERVVADDFTLTEKDCILFMRQICEGVAYMHSQMIVHLDLKPENIMCYARTSHEIKIIDFGIAQKLNPDHPVRVLFGTPEFAPPEVINYEPIGVESDMWSLGVICYVLLSGLSPFMGNNDAETFANITRADFDFEDEAFYTVSEHARNFIAALLVKRKEERLSAKECLKHIWLDPNIHQETVILCTDKLKKFIIRRKWQKTGNAIRAVGRMVTLSASRRNSANNAAPTTPRQSFPENLISKMTILNEENQSNNLHNQLDESQLAHIDSNAVLPPTHGDITEEECASVIRYTSQVSTGDETAIEDSIFPDSQISQTRACTERSDSGISDCSTHLTSVNCSCTSTPLLGRKFPINEEYEYQKTVNLLIKTLYGETIQTSIVKNSSSNEIYSKHSYRKDSVISATVSTTGSASRTNSDKLSELITTNQTGVKVGNASKLTSKIVAYKSSLQVKCKPLSASNSLKRLPMYSVSSVANTIKKFNNKDDISKSATDAPNKPKEDTSEFQEQYPEKSVGSIDHTFIHDGSSNMSCKISNSSLENSPANFEKTSTVKISSCRNVGNSVRLSNLNNFKNGELHSRVVSVELPQTEDLNHVSNDKNSNLEQESSTALRAESLTSKNKLPTLVNHKCPSPSLLRKTKTFMGKQYNEEHILTKHMHDKEPYIFDSKNNKSSQMPPSPMKLKNESFQRDASFWNTPKIL